MNKDRGFKYILISKLINKIRNYDLKVAIALSSKSERLKLNKYHVGYIEVNKKNILESLQYHLDKFGDDAIKYKEDEYWIYLT